MSAPMLTALRTFMSAVVMLGVTYVSIRQGNGPSPGAQHSQLAELQKEEPASTSSDPVDHASSLRGPEQLHLGPAETSGRELPAAAHSQPRMPLLARTIAGVVPAGMCMLSNC